MYNVSCENENQELLIMNTRTERHVKLSKELASKWNNMNEDISEKDFDNDSAYKRLLEKEFIVKREFDEANWIQMKHNAAVFGDDMLSVTILPTNDCNFRCVYCYEEHKKSYMTDETEENIIKFFQKRIPKVNKVRINWFGGEPLLDKERVLKISKVIHDTCKQNGVPLIAAMNTNAYLLDLDTFKKLVACRVLYYEICIDGDRETHNAHRPHYEEGNSFDIIIKNLLNIKENLKTGTFKIALRTNITPKVSESLDKYIDFIQQHFKNDKRFSVYFQGVRNWGGRILKMK